MGCGRCGAPPELICVACGFANDAEDDFVVGKRYEPISDLMRGLMDLTADIVVKTRIKAVGRAVADGLS